MRAAVYGRQSSNKAKSIAEQLAAGHRIIDEQGWTSAGDYQDGRSASRFGTKIRGDWMRVLDDVAAHAMDVLILWESSRGDRTPETWFAFLSLCRSSGVRIYVITHDRLYDPGNAREWKTLGVDGVDSAYESELLSIRVKRGHAGAAAAGLPPGGPTPYGYRRTFDPATGQRLGQVICEPEAVVVREIFRRVAAGHTIAGIAEDLNTRAVPRKRDGVWARCTIREIVRNPAYIGVRVLHGTRHQGNWAPLLTEAQWLAARQILAQPGRRTTRPGQQKHLLSYLGRCAVCDGWLNQVAGCYRCLKGCVSIPKGVTDVVVTEAVLARLARPDFTAARSDGDDGDADRAALEAEVLRGELNGWRLSAARKETTPESLAVIEQDLQARIAAADRRSIQSGVPAVLLAMLEPGVDVRQRWQDMTVISRRALVDTLCAVRVSRGRPGRRGAGESPSRIAFERLGGSQWHGEQRSWSGQLLEPSAETTLSR